MNRTSDNIGSKLKAGKNPKPVPSTTTKRSKNAEDDSLLPADSEDPKLSQLDFEIRSRERTLALLSAKVQVENPWAEQIADRDRLVEKLNVRIVDLEAKVQSAEIAALAGREKQLKHLQRERADLYKQVAALEERALKAESETADVRTALEKEKGELELLNEGLTEELEALKAQMKIKDENLQSAKQDVLEMSRIVKELSALNSEFNEKVLQMNKDVEKRNTELFTAQAKAKQTEELEQELLLTKTENQQLKRRAAKVTQMKADLVAIEDSLKTARESLKSLESTLTHMGSSELQPVIEEVARLRTALGRKVADRTVAEDPVLLKDEIRELKSALAEKTSEAAKLVAVQETFAARIAELEKERETVKGDLVASNEKLQKRVKSYQEAMDKFKAKSDQLEASYSQSEANYQKAQTQLVALQSQKSILKSRKNAEAATEAQYEATIRDLRNQLAALRSQKMTQELSINNRETVLKAHAMQLKILQDEIWKKDTEVMKLRKVGSEEPGERKVTHREAEAMMKVRSAAELATASSELEAKDREIAMLKDLLKNANQQLKAREAEITRLKKRLEAAQESQNSGNSGVDFASLFAVLQEYDETQSLVERVETEAKLPKQAIRSALKTAAVPDTKPEALNLLKRKLRETHERLEGICQKKPQATVTLRSNILLNSAKLRELAQVPDLPLSTLSTRLALQDYGLAPAFGSVNYGSPSVVSATPQRSQGAPVSHMSKRVSAPPFAGVGQAAPGGSRGAQFGGLGSRIVGERPGRHQASYSMGQDDPPPFSTNSSITREELDRQMQRQRQQDFMASINQQLQEKRSQQMQQSRSREAEMQQRLKDLEKQRQWEQSERERKLNLLSSYRQVLDSQSGQSEKQQFEVSAKRFYGVDEAPASVKDPGKDFRESAKKFYGVDESFQDDSGNASLTRSPSRLAKTTPKTVMTDPITGAVRNIPASRQRVLSLGNQRPVYVSGKINDSPPPPSVFAEQPNFGKKVPRKVFFNPLTGERRVIGEDSSPSRQSSDNPFRRHYENSSYYQRFQEDFLR